MAEIVALRAAIVKVVCCGHPMRQMIQRTVESEPVEIFSFCARRGAPVECVDPARESLVGGEAAIGALPYVAMRGDETRE